MNDSIWYRNLTLDTIATRQLYEQAKKNRELTFKDLNFTKESLEQLEALTQMMEAKYRTYLEEERRTRPDPSTFMNQFKLYS